MKNALIVLSIIVFSHISLAQKKGSWGDQGNGTYKNPVLEANFPDNDVIKVKDTYYMMSSTNHWAPGMIILKSKDLVNWQYSNNIMQAPITYDISFSIGQPQAADNRATWAGSFGFNGEYYFAYWCFNKRHLKGGKYNIIYAKSKSIEGPWSQPEEVLFKDGSSINTTDPGVLWDIETHKAWFTVNVDHEVKIFPLSWDGKQVLQNANEGIFVTKELSGESNKLYKFGDDFYAMNSHVGNFKGEQIRMQVFSRAKKMEGPWESKIVLSNGNGIDRHPSQGTLLKLDDGSWWFIHQLARGEVKERYNGRPQFLEPVVWKDGWPLIGVDTDGDGIGEVVWQNKKPISGSPITAPATDDNFSKSTLGLQWNWRYNPKMDRWSLTERPGFLRLKSCVSAQPTKEPESIKLVPNLLAQRTMGRFKNVMTTKFDVSGMAAGQEAGLHVSAGHNHVIGIKQDEAGNKQLFYKSDTNNKEAIVVVKGAMLNQNEVWLQAKIENGLATFFYSLDGKKYFQMGDQNQLFFSGFTPNMVGFYTKNSVEKGFVDVDWFTYDYDGPKGK